MVFRTLKKMFVIVLTPQLSLLSTLLFQKTIMLHTHTHTHVCTHTHTRDLKVKNQVKMGKKEWQV